MATNKKFRVKHGLEVNTLSGSTSTLVFPTTDGTANQVIKTEASNQKYLGIMGYNSEPLVSSDFMQDPHSSIYDAEASMELNSTFFKLVSWYDNEYGYSTKLVELIHKIHNS